ncbi:MAG TPA: diguanylate cyclase [Candidatus Binatia bacterium]|nr:diguanylate cyclase [Candidatus Binatia bacterium]
MAGLPERTPADMLIIDDDPVSSSVLRRILERAGYQCRAVCDSRSAWDLLSPELSLVLLDIQMPGDNGPEILRRMRLDPMLADIPVIFVTARSDPSTRIHCLAMGAVGFIAKPFRPRDVLDQVRAALERGRREEDAFDDDEADPLEAALEPEMLVVSADGALALAAAGDGGGSGKRASGVSAPEQVLRDLLAERRAMRRSLASHGRLVSALFRLHQAMRNGASPDVLARTVVALAEKALRARAAELWRGDRDGVRPLVSRDAACGAGSENGAGVTGATGGGAPGFREEAVLRAFRDWLTVAVEIDGGKDVDVHFPLAVGTDRLGVLSMRFPADGRPSDSLAAFFCAEVALALDSAIRFDRAQRDAVVDALTGVYNRRYLESRLPDEVDRARAEGTPLSVLFVDLDRFKQINDRFGHDAGDRLLRLVAGRITASLRAVDVVARYGGDEFVAILPGTDRDGSRAVAARLRAAIAEAARLGGNETAEATVTVGGATFPDDGATAAELLASADAAMLRGKRAGRDRVELFERVTPAAALDRVAKNRRETTLLLRTMIGALQDRDAATASHSRAVSGLAARLARHLGCSSTDVQLAGQVGLLHDIGKLHTPTRILLKPGPLDETEREIMNLHAEVGAELVESVAGIRHLAVAVRASQEHYDGNGYPDGLAGEAIPLAARIVAVADAYHAMTTDRPYRAALPAAAVEAELRRCAGTQFDPKVVEALLEMVADGKA